MERETRRFAGIDEVMEYDEEAEKLKKLGFKKIVEYTNGLQSTTGTVEEYSRKIDEANEKGLETKTLVLGDRVILFIKE